MEINFFNDVVLPFVGFIVFFVIQATGKASEKLLTFVVIFLTVGIFIFKYNAGELMLFLVGLVLGLTIEIGLRKLGHQQTWSQASLSGVPYWLPLVWGIGFVIITRLGLFIRSY